MRIAVYCGSSPSVDPVYLALGEEMGRLLAAGGHVVVYGGGRVGVMGALSRGARAAGGRVEGVILDRFLERGLGDPEVASMAVAADMRARKAGLEERAEAHLVLPGGGGTLDELFEVLALKYLGLNRKRVVLLDPDGFFGPLFDLLERMAAERFLLGGWARLLARASRPEEALRLLEPGAP